MEGGYRNLLSRELRAIGWVREELTELVKSRLVDEVIHHLNQTGEFEAAIESIVEGKLDPYTACDNLVLPKLGLAP